MKSKLLKLLELIKNPAEDKRIHFKICFLLAAIATVFFILVGCNMFVSGIAGICIALAAGLGKEYGDKMSPGNVWDWADVTFDALGAVSGSFATIVIVSLLLLLF